MKEHSGHRDRIRNKLDSDVLQDHEVLEVFLFIAIPRRNTNDIAHRLISAFGSVEGVFTAKYEELRKVEGIGDTLAGYIASSGTLFRKHFGKLGQGYRGVFEHRSFLAYVKSDYVAEKQEIVDVYLLDEENVIDHRRRFSGNDKFTVELDPDALSELILRYRPAGLVVVHNHPSGKAEPSAADDKTTEKCQLLCSYHNVLFCDHYIYSPEGVYSYYLSGKLRDISEKFSLQTVLSGSAAKEGV